MSSSLPSAKLQQLHRRRPGTAATPTPTMTKRTRMMDKRPSPQPLGWIENIIALVHQRTKQKLPVFDFKSSAKPTPVPAPTTVSIKNETGPNPGTEPRAQRTAAVLVARELFEQTARAQLRTHNVQRELQVVRQQLESTTAKLHAVLAEKRPGRGVRQGKGGDEATTLPLAVSPRARGVDDAWLRLTARKRPSSSPIFSSSLVCAGTASVGLENGTGERSEREKCEQDPPDDCDDLSSNREGKIKPDCRRRASGSLVSQDQDGEGDGEGPVDASASHHHHHRMDAADIPASVMPDETLLAWMSLWLLLLVSIASYGGPNMYMPLLVAGLVSLFSVIVVGYPFRISRVTASFPRGISAAAARKGTQMRLARSWNENTKKKRRRRQTRVSRLTPVDDDIAAPMSSGSPQSCPTTDRETEDGCASLVAGPGTRQQSSGSGNSPNIEGKLANGDAAAVAEEILAGILEELGEFYPDVELERFLPVADLGLDSITSDFLCRRLTERFGVPLAPADLPQVPSLVQLANHIAMAALSIPRPPLPLLPSRPPGFSLQGIRGFSGRPGDPGGVWERCPADRFEVRSGPDYRVKREKRVAGAPFYEPVAVDILTSSSKIDHVARFIDLDSHWDGSQGKTSRDELLPADHPGGNEGKHTAHAVPDSNNGWIDGVPDFFVVNIQLPLYEPRLWGSSDGYGLNMVFYFRLSVDGVRSIKAGENPSKLLRQFCELAGNPNHPNWQSLGRRWKNIVHISNQADLKLNFVMKEVVRKFSGKPFLTRSHKEIFKGRNYIELDINQHTSNYVKKQTVFKMKQHLAAMMLEIGFLLESQDDDEMPEKLIGAIRLHGIDFEKEATEVVW
eukprot:CAMPEP_0114500712 /NCGR_PEP_ID=MMETSP0109-20121206/8109_1 /TAXON_ID=29199 /ORGANISM="Chlorarachnion reptans, Strain CCCM449" /LENGTH=848 /DNA_ID=CAMNT_0001678389 /DNA_START=684 /DNA_END=3227 /DNA_ORIENTATION=+